MANNYECRDGIEAREYGGINGIKFCCNDSSCGYRQEVKGPIKSKSTVLDGLNPICKKKTDINDEKIKETMSECGLELKV